MVAEIVPIIGAIVLLVGSILSAVVTQYFLRKATSPEGTSLTQKQKYIHPLVTLVGTCMIIGIGGILMFLPSFILEDTSIESWFLLSASSISCPGFFLFSFMLIYMVRLWLYENHPKHRRDT